MTYGDGDGVEYLRRIGWPFTGDDFTNAITPGDPLRKPVAMDPSRFDQEREEIRALPEATR